MSLTARLTLGFFVITLAALGVVFSYVIPTLESRLRADKLHALEESARLFGPELRQTFSSSLNSQQVDGLVEQIGAPLELYDRPQNLFVAGFIGSPAMNFLKGKIRANGQLQFQSDGGVPLPLAGAPGGTGIRREDRAIGHFR